MPQASLRLTHTHCSSNKRRTHWKTPEICQQAEVSLFSVRSQTTSLHQQRTATHHQPTESIKSFQYVITHFAWPWRASSVESNSAASSTPGGALSVTFFKFQPCDHTPPQNPTTPIFQSAWFVVKTMTVPSCFQSP